MNKNKLVEDFLSLQCSGDILNVVNPLTNPSKEITESMVVIKRLKSLALENKMQYILVDLYAGNALTSIIACHLLPFKTVLAIDKKKRNRHYYEVKRFMYLENDINNLDYGQEFLNPFILTATHACERLAITAIEIYKKYDSCKGLVLIPCCIGKFKNTFSRKISKKIGKYYLWANYLAELADGKFFIENDCLSPCNAIIVASK